MSPQYSQKQISPHTDLSAKFTSLEKSREYISKGFKLKWWQAISVSRHLANTNENPKGNKIPFGGYLPSK